MLQLCTVLLLPPVAGMVSATLASLSQGGQFVEIGKRDIWSLQRMAQERPDVQYQLVAVDFLPIKVGFCVALQGHRLV